MVWYQCSVQKNKISIPHYSWRLKDQLDVTCYFLFHFLCAQHVSDINISIFRSLRQCCWITTSVFLFSVRCVLEIWCDWILSSARAAGFSLQHGLTSPASLGSLFTRANIGRSGKHVCTPLHSLHSAAALVGGSNVTFTLSFLYFKHFYHLVRF